MQVESLEFAVAPDPPVRAYDLDLASMFLADASADAEALLEMVIDQHHIDCRTIDPEAVRQLSQQAPRPRHVRASVRGGEVVAFGPWPSTQLGLAFDIGTTKIAGYLVDLDTRRHAGRPRHYESAGGLRRRHHHATGELPGNRPPSAGSCSKWS